MVKMTGQKREDVQSVDFNTAIYGALDKLVEVGLLCGNYA